MIAAVSALVDGSASALAYRRPVSKSVAEVPSTDSVKRARTDGGVPVTSTPTNAADVLPLPLSTLDITSTSTKDIAPVQEPPAKKDTTPLAKPTKRRPPKPPRPVYTPSQIADALKVIYAESDTTYTTRPLSHPHHREGDWHLLHYVCTHLIVERNVPWFHAQWLVADGHGDELIDANGRTVEEPSSADSEPPPLLALRVQFTDDDDTKHVVLPRWIHEEWTPSDLQRWMRVCVDSRWPAISSDVDDNKGVASMAQVEAVERASPYEPPHYVLAIVHPDTSVVYYKVSDGLKFPVA